MSRVFPARLGTHFVHVEATRAAARAAACCRASWPECHDDLVRMPPTTSASCWLVASTETLRRPEVTVLVDAIHARMADQRDVLLGTAV